MYRINTIENGNGLKYNTVVDAKHQVYEITEEFTKFKHIMKNYFSNYHDIQIKEDILKLLFVELLMFLSENKDLVFSSDKTQKFIDDILVDECDLSVIIDYDEIIEVSNMDDNINMLLNKIRPYYYVDYLIYKSSIKLIFKKDFLLREEEDTISKKIPIEFPGRLSVYCLINDIDIKHINFHMLLNEMVDISISLIKTGGNVNIEDRIFRMLDNTKLLKNNASDTIKLTPDVTMIEIFKDLIYSLMDSLLLYESVIVDNTYGFIVETIMNESIILSTIKK